MQKLDLVVDFRLAVSSTIIEIPRVPAMIHLCFAGCSRVLNEENPGFNVSLVELPSFQVLKHLTVTAGEQEILLDTEAFTGSATNWLLQLPLSRIIYLYTK